MIAAENLVAGLSPHVGLQFAAEMKIARLMTAKNSFEYFASDEWLANEVRCSLHTAKRARQWMVKVGFLERTKGGGRFGGIAHYRFKVPDYEQIALFDPPANWGHLIDQLGPSVTPTGAKSMNRTYLLSEGKTQLRSVPDLAEGVDDPDGSPPPAYDDNWLPGIAAARQALQ